VSKLHSHIRSISTGAEVSRLTGECDSCGKELIKEIGLLVYSKTKVFVCERCLIVARRVIFEEEEEEE